MDKSIIDLLLSTSGPKERRNALFSNLLLLIGDLGSGEGKTEAYGSVEDSQR